MGNSLLDILVFGRISGKSAGLFALNDAKEGALTIEHVEKFHQELEAAGTGLDRVAPMLLPDYTLQHVKDRQLTAHYVGTMR
jgi:succinate dehydrogenase / fumarate reductase flavoprotein subunit